MTTLSVSANFPESQWCSQAQFLLDSETTITNLKPIGGRTENTNIMFFRP
jgi:hypothetical protein